MKKMMITLTLLVLATGFSGYARAATLITDAAGRLLGANGVTVGGLSYDVMFAEGNCNTGSPACIITFGDIQSATDASQALLDQVFIGIYDGLPAQTYGIRNTAFGYALTPYKLSRGHVFTQAAKNNAGALDTVVPITVDVNVQPLFSYNTASDDRAVMAVWTPAPSPVPLPGAVWLFASGLGLFGLLGRSRQDLS